MAAKKTYSLYLAKEEVGDFDDLLTENAKHHIAGGRCVKVFAPDFGQGAYLYLFKARGKDPEWLTQIRSVFNFEDEIKTQSPCALIILKTNDRFFGLNYSYGHAYLDDRKTVADFGLRAAINFVSDRKLKSIERSNIGVAIRDFAQAASHKELQAFGIDDVLDLIRKVSGSADKKKAAETDDFADRVVGARSFRVTCEDELADLADVAGRSLALFEADDYKNTAFKVIDFLSPVLDPLVVEDLDCALVGAIKDGGDQFELSQPEILGDHFGAYIYTGAHIKGSFPDISLDHYRTVIGPRLAKLTVADLKKNRIAVLSDDGDYSSNTWSLYRGLVGSVAIGDERYALNEGYWYKFGDKVKESADTLFESVKGEPDPKFPIMIKKISKKGKGINGYQTELSYNTSVAENSNYYLLDQRLVKFDGMTGGGIEACDLLDIEGKRFIHVKKSSRQSSVLSHFFKQGYNAARLFRCEPSFRRGIGEVIKKHYSEEDAKKVEDALADDEGWTVEYQIADYPRSDGEHTIPFFSKLSLRDEVIKITAMPMKASIRFITLPKS